MSTAKKKAAKPKKLEVKFAVTVIAEPTRIGAMICLKGTRANLPEDKAKALEKMGKVRIDGVA